MFKNFAAMFAYMVAFLNFTGNEKALIKDGELNLTDKQKEDLQKSLGPKRDLEAIVKAMNQELADLAKAEDDQNDGELLDLRQKAFDMLKAHGLSQEDAEKLTEHPAGATSATEKEMLAGLTAAMAEQDKKIAKLLSSAEEDSPLHKIKQTLNPTMQHSKTHLFGSNHQLDAFDGRKWNQRAAGLTTAPTDFFASASGVEVDVLKGDIDHFYRENPTFIKDIMRENEGLPSFWPMISNISDEVANAVIVTDEVTQARKKNYLPKGKQAIQAETRKAFPVNIDLKYVGYELQKIETMWINSLYNREGSSPYKYHFIAFLLTAIIKRARQEDRLVATKGVFVKTPDSATIPGMAIHRGDGLFIQLWRALHIDKKYKYVNIGVPTAANIVDYAENLIKKNLPAEEINNPNLVLYMSPSWVEKYKKRKRIEMNGDTILVKDELVMIENFPNIGLHGLFDLEGTDYMFITYMDNISTIQNRPNERGLLNMGKYDPREISVYGDYKWGCGAEHIGTKVKDGDPLSFKVQTVWSNGLSPFPEDFFVRLYDNTTGEVALPYSNITITDDYATSIETLTGAYAGQIIKIKGNTAVGAGVKVVDDGNITLTGNADFPLNSGGILTLRATTATTFKEVKRTETPPVLPDADVNFSGTVIDALLGYEFNYTGGAATITDIVNGVEGQEIVVNGGAGGALTFADVAGKINVGSGAVLANGADNITLTVIDGIWEEVARTIA
tara:strand:- start:705 stop:2888 length:2184 start_codon:yes stop_codon:yes gene_type:complete